MSRETEGTIVHFIYQLLENKPQPPKSIGLDIDTEDRNIQSKFKCLIDIFTLMMKFLHGDENGQVTLSKLTNIDIEIVVDYFKSFGYMLYMQVNENGNKIYANFKEEDVQLKGDNEEELINQCFNLNSEGKSYRIFFDNL